MTLLDKITLALAVGLPVAMILAALVCMLRRKCGEITGIADSDDPYGTGL